MARRTKKPITVVEMGKRGFASYMRNTTPEQRSQWARKAIAARWAKYRAAKKSNEPAAAA